MHLHNKHGTPVDPVPFAVVSMVGLLVNFSYGPPYLITLGLPLPHALVVAGVATLVVGAASYHRYVWTARPEHRGIVSPAERLKRLFYGALIGLALLALLALPLLVR